MGAIAAKIAGNSGGSPPSGSVTLGDLAPLAAFAVIGNETAASATPTAVKMNAVPGSRSQATAAGTTTLVNTDKGIQVFTGSTTQTVVLPVVSTLIQTGWSYVIINQSSGALTINSSGGNLVQTAAANTTTLITCVLLTGTTAASWSSANVGGSGISGLTANTVPKALTATTIGNSHITDDGTDIIVNNGGGVTYLGNTNAGVNNNGISLNALTGETNINSGSGTTTIGDVGGAGNSTTLTVDDAAGSVTVGGGGVNFISRLIIPIDAGDGTVGTTLKPYTGIFIGDAANNSAQLTGTFTGNKVVTFPDASGTVVLTNFNRGIQLVCPILSSAAISATGTQYVSPSNSSGLVATEANVSFPVTTAGTIRNLYARTNATAKVNTPTTIITVRKNGADTSLTLTLTQTTSTTSSDTTHSFTCVAGDLITVSIVTTGAAAVSCGIASINFELD